MKKSLVAMALMFGAVVCFSACGGGDDPVTAVKKCKVYKLDKNGGADKVSSLYPNEFDEGSAPTGYPATGAGVTADGDLEGTTYKDGTYKVVCQ
jgi:hypothetical protein